jgi:hypothetical protein
MTWIGSWSGSAIEPAGSCGATDSGIFGDFPSAAAGHVFSAALLRLLPVDDR